MSSTAGSTASSWAARASSMRPERQQLRPVGDRAVGHRVAPEVRHRAVGDRDGEQELRLAHDLLLERQHRLDRLERVVVVIQLDRVGADRLLVVLQVGDARAGVLAADAVGREDDLVADVDRAEPCAAREDVDEVRDLVVAQRLHLGPPGARLDAGVDVGLDLRPGHAHQRPVAHTRRDAFHRPLRRSGGVRAAAAAPAATLAASPAATRGYRPAPRLSAADTSAKLTAARAKGEGTAADARRRRSRQRRAPAKGTRPRGERGLEQGLWGKPSWWGVFACQRKEPLTSPQRMLRPREAARTRAKEGLPLGYRGRARTLG